MNQSSAMSQSSAKSQVITLRPKPLSQEAFAPFGDVIEAGMSEPVMINAGNTERYHALSEVELSSAEDRAILSIFRAQARTLPMPITMMERHPLGSQSFQPLGAEDYLVLVGEAVEDLRAEHLHLFLAKANQGVNYHRNTWHHPVLALNDTSDFLVVDRSGSGNNCEEISLQQPIEIRLN